MQCKDIPEEPILKFLSGPFDEWLVPGWATWFEGYPNSIRKAMPSGVSPKLARAKMSQMIDKGLVDGCACGCRGDFRLPERR